MLASSPNTVSLLPSTGATAGFWVLLGLDEALPLEALLLGVPALDALLSGGTETMGMGIRAPPKDEPLLVASGAGVSSAPSPSKLNFFAVFCAVFWLIESDVEVGIGEFCICNL